MKLPVDTEHMDAAELISNAREAYEAAYAPYSEYRVGAAVLTEDGTVYTGCNIENANYSNSLHAEEVALGSAIRDGHRAFEMLAVASDEQDGVTPCGMCRQTLAEFCPEDFEIHCDAEGDIQTYLLGDLLPETISADTLDVETEDTQ
jgi:cytidine deaminase